jgi:hypothetical protein
MMKDVELNEDFKKRWIAALRTGDYKQGSSMLFNEKNNRYCCLGVACIIEGLSPNILMGRGYPNELSTDVKTDNLRELGPVEGELAELNDHDGLSFSQIADYIELNY